MKLYNTLTKSVDEISPLNPPTVTIYTCGPTVYDFAHIGHWFNYVRMDILIRTLKANNFNTKWVMNITDVGHLTSDADEGEDKLIKSAQKEGKSAWEIADFYTKDFLSGMQTLNILKPDYLTKATDHIEDQIALIKILEEKSYTYLIVGDGVYFDTSKFSSYAVFARLDLDEQSASARIDENKQKKNPWDFALWRLSPPNSKRDMEWDSPWGMGFPGWHIECSAMSMKYLGETLDIHSGGIDHIPIHHTNEIAQSEAATGKKYALNWMHANHVLFNNQKISKSLGNTIKLSDLSEKGFSSEVLRLHVLESHYRNQSTFSWTSLEAAKNRLSDLYSMAALRYQPRPNKENSIKLSLENVTSELINIISNDLNTPQCLTLLSNLATQLMDSGISSDDIINLSTSLEGIDNLLGLKLSRLNDVTPDQKNLIKTRDEARTNNDFAKADSIRQELLSQSIGLRDYEFGSVWFPI
ncbi:MAG TPA: cysteine--tRNA ligase [Patescibacteria group bacterium]|nr:cysteine--tRNA ligase [Patescibacteria group bacterium]